MNISFKKSLVALATIASLSVTLSPVVNAADVPSGVQLAKEQVLKEGTRDYPVTMDPAKAVDAASNSVLLGPEAKAAGVKYVGNKILICASVRLTSIRHPGS